MNSKRGQNDLMMRLGMAVLPLLVFVTIYELVSAALTLVWQKALESASIGAAASFWYDVPDVTAVITGISMAVALLPLARMAGDEIRVFAKPDGHNRAAVDRRDVKFRRDTETEYEATASPVSIPGRKPVLYYTAVLVMSLGLSLGINILISLMTSAGAGEIQNPGTAAAVTLPLGLAVYGMLTPVIEETVFRGLTYTRLRRLLRTDGVSDLRISVVLSALLFGLWHGSLAQGIYAFVMGVIFAGHYEWSRNFGSTVFLHALINILTLILAAGGVYNEICTPVWCACSLAAGVLGGGILLWMSRSSS